MKKLFLSLLAVAAMASCSKTELSERPDKGSAEIKMKTTVMGIDTKSPFDATDLSVTNLTAQIPASKSKTDFSASNLYANGTMTFVSGAEVGYNSGYTGSNYYPADDSKIYICGLFPANDGTTDWTIGTTKAEYTITGTEDVMSAPAVETQKSTSSSAVPALAFTHKTTKFIIKAIAENQAAADAWGDISAISFTKAGGATQFGSIASITLETGACVFNLASPTPVSNWPVYGASETGGVYTYTNTVLGTTTQTIATAEDQTAAEAAVIAYTLMPPFTAQTATDPDLTLKVTTAKKSTGFPVEIILYSNPATSTRFTGSTAANQFTITLTFKATEIKAKATVTGWADGGSADGEIK